MSSSLCGCCRRGPKESQPADANSVSAYVMQTQHVQLSVQTPAVGQRSSSLLSNETPGQTAGRLRGQLDTMRQRKEDEKQSQQQNVSSSVEEHRHRMDDMKSGHDAEMSVMQQSNRDNTKACSATMAKMSANNQREMEQNMAKHNANMATMRQNHDGVEVKRNERVNVLKLANAQRMTNLEQRLDAQCSDFKQKQHASDMVHSQRMKMMSFSHVGQAGDARNRNASDLKTQRQDTKVKREAQQGKVDAANARHHHNIDGEKVRHGKEMSEMKTSSDADTATHESKMGRMNDKNQHKKDDANHMALHFVSLESKVKESEARCAGHEQTLAENAQMVSQGQRRHDLLIAQSEVIGAVKAAIKKDKTQSAEQTATVKRTKFNREDKDAERGFLRNKIQFALDCNRAFDTEMMTFLGTLSELNGQIRTE